MIGLLLVSHGNLCEYMLKSTAMIVGNIEQACAVPLNPGETPQNYENRVRKAIADLDTGEGIIALVDVLGGTPYNTVGSLSRECKLQIITGMNMPMTVYFTMERNNGHLVEKLMNSACEAAKSGIKILQPCKNGGNGYNE
ncbi:PTS sugar transporter subunit IIA [Pectinatus frisingensis]|jgi:mannose/fructose/sorbose-specific phosphotransferase system IIA component|uniref:PTS sugar transporter subunit IIA n=1 Tax=Pectinatus frisingensis TaxID=865 RepID=UPI0018C689C7|nr:PTS sugar transporter subunit IIA [Pectinatus frisingensis]